MRYSILTIKEANCPAGAEPYDANFILKTDESDRIIVAVIDDVERIKYAADDGISLEDFKIPKDWDGYGWHEKVETVVKFLVKKYDIGKIVPSNDFEFYIS